jgi:hypothetical protein
MPFGLKNAGATFQRLMRKALGAQMGRNVEAYVEDIIVKTRESRTFIEDLEETFANLRKVNIKLNPPSAPSVCRQESCWGSSCLIAG